MNTEPLFVASMYFLHKEAVLSLLIKFMLKQWTVVQREHNKGVIVYCLKRWYKTNLGKSCVFICLSQREVAQSSDAFNVYNVVFKSRGHQYLISRDNTSIKQHSV